MSDDFATAIATFNRELLASFGVPAHLLGEPPERVIDERQALLKTIIENRDDDTPRLIYADWLEENGEG